VKFISIGIAENLNKSLDFTKNRLFGNWIDWVILVILCLVPIIGWLFLAGFIIRVYRGGETKLVEWFRMLTDGILATIICIVYSIVPMIVLTIFGSAILMNSMVTMSFNAATTTMAGVGVIVSIIILLTVSIIFGTLCSMAVVRFAKEESFGAAFQFGNVFKIIGKIGWFHCIMSVIVLSIISAVICFICELLMFVLIGFILLPLLAPFLTIWQAKFIANLYESA
jgi:hypothetical protein